MFMERPYLVLSLWKYEEVIQLHPPTTTTTTLPPPPASRLTLNATFSVGLCRIFLALQYVSVRVCATRFARVCSDTSGR